MLFPSLDDCFKSQHSTISFILVLMKDLSDTSIAQFFWQCAIFRALPQSRHADLFDERHNENRNGRIRRYLPKKTSFDRLTQAELDAIVGEVNDTPDEAPRLQDTQRGMGRGDCQTTIKDDRSGNGCCTYKLNPGLPTFVILFARLAGVFMAPASTLLLSLAIEFQIFEAKVEQLLRQPHLSLFLILEFTVSKSICLKGN